MRKILILAIAVVRSGRDDPHPWSQHPHQQRTQVLVLRGIDQGLTRRVRSVTETLSVPLRVPLPSVRVRPLSGIAANARLFTSALQGGSREEDNHRNGPRRVPRDHRPGFGAVRERDRRVRPGARKELHTGIPSLHPQPALRRGLLRRRRERTEVHPSGSRVPSARSRSLRAGCRQRRQGLRVAEAGQGDARTPVMRP
jgi:hypothetical protein